MMVALAWLTVSIPFVYDCQQRIAETKTINITNPLQEEECNSFSTNTTEEKHESGSNSLSEYIHDMHLQLHYIAGVVKYRKCHPSDLYYAFHPELISPPPEA